MSRDNKSQHIFITTFGHCFEVHQGSLDGKIFLSSSILVLDLVGHPPLEKLGQGAVVIFWLLQPFCGKPYDQSALSSHNPMAIR